MNLSCLLALIQETPAYRQLSKGLIEPKSDEHKLVMLDAAKPYLIASIHRELNIPVLVVTAQPENAREIYEQLQVWCHSSSWLQLFPEPDFPTSEYSTTDPTTVAERLQILSDLSFYRNGSLDRPPLIITSAAGVTSRTTPQADFATARLTLKIGDSFDLFNLIEKWQATGYELENIVEVPGTISHRGGIVDVFPPNSDLPARIEFFGNQIDSIRLFDPKTQLSLKLIDSMTITPAKENRLRSNDISAISDYLPHEAILILDNRDEIEVTIDKMNSQSENPNRFPYLTLAQFQTKIERARQRLILYSWNSDTIDKQSPTSLPLASVPSYGGRLEAFSKALKQMLEENRRIVIVSQHTNRLLELLQEQGILAHSVSTIEQVPLPGSVTLVQGSLAEGWSLPDNLTLLTDNEIFGLVKQRRLFKKRPVRHHWFASELKPGDYVVHIGHGIAKFTGLTKMLTDNIEQEYLVLEYAANDRLYVPIAHIDHVSRYIGADAQSPTLSRLGTQEWSRAKQRIKESVVKIARELLTLYAAREVTSGLAFSPDTIWQQELEASFPYLETPDQMEAIQAVKHDMEKPMPMDRLVCGDVGYGKTEVALRAAFKAIMDNKQVALLVPTTVLAQQHLITFRDRLQAFPVRVEMLSRFRSGKEQTSIINGLAAGTIDICIGTHRLLQKDVAFKNLGLIVIDEEQRFGVTHKEHFKKLRQEIDVLTLSATPIPRTLHMSLAGIRDMSTMETPPEERLPIKTHVGIYDDSLVREAILRELQRNGQVFYVHNRVQSIASVASRLGNLIPEAEVSIAHGQMAEEKLGEVMAEFTNRKTDILVSTTIIESGLDIPNVNTLIVDQADRLGLSQLYQLRGRVGRGSNDAYAYFLYNKSKQLTPQSRKRLRTIFEATELGAGFGIAMRDLEIRGAGNLLGVEQSGYIAVVGFDLYCRLLAEAVDNLKQKQPGKNKHQPSPPAPPNIALPLDVYIPEEYVPDLSTRLTFYQRIASMNHAEEIENMAREFNDRFGVLPQPVKNLLYVAEIRQLATDAGVESISVKDRQIILHSSKIKKLQEIYLPPDYSSAVKIGTERIKLDMKRLKNSWPQVLKEIFQTIAADTLITRTKL